MMETRTRFSTQSKDPFAGSILFGSGNSPQPVQSHSPVMQHTSNYALSPMQAMDGISTIRSPFQARRFGETAPPSAKKTPGGTVRRPPLSSILDNKPSFSSQILGDEGFTSQPVTPGPAYASSEQNTATDSARKFPLRSADSLRTEFTNPSTGRLGLGAGTGGNAGVGPAFGSPAFGSPAPARPPLRSVLDGYSSSSRGGGDTRTPNRYGADLEDEDSEDNRRRADAARLTSPVLTLAPYTPGGNVLEAAWSCWVVVSGFYPSSTARESVLQLFLSFGDIQDHVSTPGNWLFIRYASPVHAERAASQHGRLLNADTLLSVLVLNPRLAQHLGIELCPDGALLVEHCADRVSQGMSATAAATASAGASYGGAQSWRGAGQGGELQSGLRHRGGSAGPTSAEEQALLQGDHFSAQRRNNSNNSGSSSSRGTENESSGAGNNRALSSAEPELYLKPHRRKSICERVVEYFFAY